MSKFSFIQDFYVKNKLKIFPVIPNTKSPLIENWQNDCSNEILQIVYWLEGTENKCNFGLPANVNNIFVLDIDVHNSNGLESFNQLCKDLNIEEPKTLKQLTPSGGIHYIFKSDEELKKVTNDANVYANYEGIDIRTNGYIVVAPSSIDGVEYKFDTTYEITEMPKELRDFILANNKTNNTTTNKIYERPNKVEKGRRDIEVFSYISNLYHNTRLNRDEITLLAHYFNKTVCEPPMSDRDIEYKIDKAFKKERTKYITIHINEGEE